MLTSKPSRIASSEITPRKNYLNRRAFLEGSALAAAGFVAPVAAAAVLPTGDRAKLKDVSESPLSTGETVNSYEDVTTYNNFYEFGTGKGDPYRNAQDFEPRPWTLEVAGHAERTGTFQLEDFVKPYALEERIYRMRCVEAWSMVIPWVGIPLASIIRELKPTASAKYVRFETLKDPQQMPGQRSRVLNWPYREGLTMAEAMHPLTIFAVGLYGEVLPNQNGAPLRLVVPWKYGFKGIKSIVKIEFVEKMPATTWAMAGPREYGFYANVNPEVDHPRWSQARERRIGGGLFASKQPTLMFNGYADQVASLYEGLNLRRNF
ncbi:MAG: protein-methionine-sulfoxide reductase catalytic subunit MsrP [Woeseia sp.]|nr:protein-methionine-sulfoxide reductase catalytic subunit MsrP [Woeseia sp.]MBT8095637.1 protein-methionine-sulfoxide reductase catalytic subunit MsrP [Woeseia sp.]NNE61527.1 protein-methionine-sulfoxide reductase catalytic subunit MsrP [Woeseia sp.]NNL54123.1 protein-methionine-sulfoxide reductase catalytic subunit MsrP [Woeseia sp.]